MTHDPAPAPTATTGPPPVPVPVSRAARIAVPATFAYHGLLDAIWLVRIPALTDKLHLGTGQVGTVGLAFGLGALLAMQIATRVLPAYGSRRLLWVTGPGTAVALGGLALSPRYGILLAVAIVLGLMAGALDVGMNAQGSTIERRTGRMLMSGMHAAWSLGCVVGGGLGALAAAGGWDFTRTALTAAVCALPVSILLATGYLPDPPDNPARRGRVRMPRLVHLAGLLVFLAFVVEGTSATWSGLYLRDDLDTREAVAALAYPLLQIAMIAGRLAGDPLRRRVGARAVVAGCGLGVAVAYLAVTAAPVWWVAAAGFVLSGLAIAPVVPLAFSVAGAADPTGSGAAIAWAGGAGYTGTLAGPVAIGYVAQATSLRSALALAIAMGLGICLLGRTIP
jgi:predicted MFS family arabinose efflux permease